MHELPVTRGILSVALEATQENGNKPIVSIDLVIGDLSSIVDDSVQFYFDILSKGTLAESAKLNIRREPATVTCLECQHEYQATAPLDPRCPNCQSPFLQAQGGQEFYVESIEVADEDTRSQTDSNG